MHKTDICRLNNISRIPYVWGRGTGVTTAAAHNLAGLIEHVPNGSVIVYVLPLYDWIRHVLPLCDRILAEHGLERKISWTRKTITCGSTRVRFINIDEHKLYGIGRFYRVFDSGECAYNYWLQRYSKQTTRAWRFWKLLEQQSEYMRFTYYEVLDGRTGNTIIRSKRRA